MILSSFRIGLGFDGGAWALSGLSMFRSGFGGGAGRGLFGFGGKERGEAGEDCGWLTPRAGGGGGVNCDEAGDVMSVYMREEGIEVSWGSYRSRMKH